MYCGYLVHSEGNSCPTKGAAARLQSPEQWNIWTADPTNLSLTMGIYCTIRPITVRYLDMRITGERADKSGIFPS
jgi:hypothetical protein